MKNRIGITSTLFAMSCVCASVSCTKKTERGAVALHRSLLRVESVSLTCR